MSSLLCGTNNASKRKPDAESKEAPYERNNVDSGSASTTTTSSSSSSASSSSRNGRRRRRHLPEPSGSHTVGIVDVMTDTDAKPCFFRLYYPTEKQDIYESEYDWPLWLPRQQYIDGFIFYLKKNPRIFGKIFNWVGGRVYIPGLVDSPPLPGDTKYPVLVFSHGLGGNRTVCSTICMHLASHGFVVASMEHRDGSASMAHFLKRKKPADVADGTASCDGSVAAGDDTKEDELEEEWMLYDNTQKWNDFGFRNKQVYQRARESVYALDVLTRINEGQSVDNLLKPSFDLALFKGLFDLSSVAAVGHSFGGTSGMCALTLDSRFKLGVILDGWMFPVDDEMYANVAQPMLFVNTAMFHWKHNIELMQRFITDDDDHRRKIITIKGTCHQSMSDFQFMMPARVGKMLGIRHALQPDVAMEMHVKAVISFLRMHLDLPGERFDDILSGDHEHILAGPYVFRKDDPLAPKKKATPASSDNNQKN